MRQIVVELFLLYSALLSLTSLPSTAEAAPHQFEGSCETCHLSAPRPGQPGIFTADIPTLCRECHAVAMHNSHPIAVTPPKDNLPADWPLDQNGQITCSTCHDPHADETPFMLRTTSTGSFSCRVCHAETEQDKGNCLISSGIAHGKAWTPPQDRLIDQSLDRISLNCLVCHRWDEKGDWDGPPAGHGSNDAAQLGQNFYHSLGRDYGNAAATNSRLRPLDDLSPQFSLYEGKIGCLTCHSPFSSRPGRLVSGNRNSGLCHECHLV